MSNILPYPWFKLDQLNCFIALAIGLFTILALLYSSRFMNPAHSRNDEKISKMGGVKGKPRLFQYYTYIILTAVVSLATVLANNLLLLLVFWGFLGLTLYLLINMGREGSEAVAKKTFIIVGGSDALMLLGIAIIYYLTGTFKMDEISIPLTSGYSPLATVAYLCLAIGCFAKAGAMPMHSWIPDCAESAPLPVVAYLPASLDKLLGIYLLARISLNLFALNVAMNIFLMLVGAVTIIAAVMMALVQHNMKRLLGYHAVSQVGYMVLGLGTGNPVGIAGGIFHMLNHAIYKSCLFLTAGNVEHKTGTADLDKLGGLAKVMPLTYISALVASLSISGVPPFNGFVSKWMVYQGLIIQFQAAGQLLRITSIVCLAAAMFGSALTLASFMKLLHAVFLGQRSSAPPRRRNNEVPWQMWFPVILLAVICLVFGVFANQIPLKYFILPVVPGVDFKGAWYAGLSTLLVIIGLILGILIFKLKGLKPAMRQDSAFVGCETRDLPEARVTGTEFYNTVKELRMLAAIYKRAEEGFFDIYEQGRKLVFSVSGVFQYLHNGILPTYLVWCLLGMMGLFLVLIR